MDRLLEYCKNNGYSLSLTNFLIELFKTYSTKASIASSLYSLPLYV